MKGFLFTVLIFLCVFTAGAQTEESGILERDSVLESQVILETPDTTVSITTTRRPVAGIPTSTPVDVDDEKPITVLHYYDKHGDPLQEPVRFLATLDTVQKVKSKPVYPAYNGINIGVNFGDLIFAAFGQKYGSYDVWANVSVYNWIFPTLECGLGFANDTPQHQNYTYNVKPSIYAKIGLDYNFLYKSNPDYRVFLGVRAGFSNFRYNLKDVTITSDYWNEDQKFSIDNLHSTSFYGEVLAGIQVKIVNHFSLGWDVRWHFNFHTSPDGYNKPWFIPGYGASSPASVHVSAIWTIPAKNKTPVSE